MDESVLPLSSRTHTVWTFKSAYAEGEDHLPLMTIAVSPELDSWDTARANTALLLPVSVRHSPGSTASEVTEVTMEISFDDGETWRRVKLSPGKDTRYGLTTNPAPGGYASLRITATDDAGNKVEQTIIHAYRIR